MPQKSEKHDWQPEVTFWAEAPPINGMLDEEKSKLPVREFPYLFKMDPGNPTVAVTYRLAYGTEFLYLLVQMDAETFICRDRGYQHGDGLLLILASPRPEDAPTDEFYMLGFWPKDDPLETVGKIVWSYNGEFPFWGLDAQFVVKAHEGRVNFELLLPWCEVHPHHPWIEKGIGFELAFVQAVGETQANWHTVALDDLGQMSIDTVRYRRLAFEKPALDEGAQTYLMLERNGQLGSPLQGRSATLAAEPFTEKLLLRTVAGEGRGIAVQNLGFPCDSGLTIHSHEFDAAGLIPGGYHVQWRSLENASQGTIGLSILPSFDLEAQGQRLSQVQDIVSPGTFATLQFRLQNLAARLAEVRPYEICPELRVELVQYLDLVQQVERGNDIPARKTGISRRAFRSELDGTLQPYSVRIPEDFDPAKVYPLLVFLHGSDRDDTALAIHNDYIGTDDFIVVAPFGRGMSNAFTKDQAQEDIQEAIQDVCSSYPIATDQIILAGFSMGGYGAYRTYYESPETFKGVAIFSGFPDLAAHYYPDEDHPMFLEDAYLEPFKEVPMFIFHGAADRNAPLEPTKQAVEKLQALGTNVEFHVRDSSGHAGPDEETTRAYHAWLARCTRD